jgi:Homing endonuclease associated repeat/HNH endonuclease
MKFELEPNNRNVTNQELIDDLKRIAVELGKGKVTVKEYNEFGKFHSSTLAERFGGWNKAVELTGLEKSKKSKYTHEELFENLENVWIKLGRQPHHPDMKSPLSPIYGSIYERRFGTWRKALEAFVEYINTNVEETQILEKVEISHYLDTQGKEIVVKHTTKRIPSRRLEMQVIVRGNFTCSFCKRQFPADELHIDHIKPWSKGGETTLENLQILCAEHNLVKGNMEL